MGYQRVIIEGNLGADPDLRRTTSGTPVATMRVAVTRKFKGQEKLQEETTWFPVVVWGSQAEHCAKYLAKGRPVLVEGRIRTFDYEDKDGVKRYGWEVTAQQVIFLPSGNGGKRPAHPADRADDAPDDYIPLSSDDDIPF